MPKRKITITSFAYGNEIRAINKLLWEYGLKVRYKETKKGLGVEFWIEKINEQEA